MTKTTKTIAGALALYITTASGIWLTVKGFNLTSYNQFTGRMKSFELAYSDSLKGTAVVMLMAAVNLVIRKKAGFEEKR